MDINKKNENGVLTIALTGRLDTATAPELEASLEESIKDATELILDFKALEYTSSAGLRVILKAQKIMNKQGKMKIINVSEDIMDVFDITGFLDILTVE